MGKADEIFDGSNAHLLDRGAFTCSRCGKMHIAECEDVSALRAELDGIRELLAEWGGDVGTLIAERNNARAEAKINAHHLNEHIRAIGELQSQLATAREEGRKEMREEAAEACVQLAKMSNGAARAWSCVEVLRALPVTKEGE